MDREKEMRFNELLLKLLDTLASMEGFNRETIRQCTIDFCQLFNLSRGTTEFYRSLSHEKRGKGEVFTDYDTGEPMHTVVERRLVTPSMAVIKGALYMADSSAPLEEDEKQKADLVLRVLLSFLSRNRLQGVVEQLAFYDDNGYRNIRSFFRYLEQLNEKGALGGYTAIHFNLRHFTLINQEIGRNAGDVVIRNYFTTIEETIGDQGLVCRVGGDNFVAVFEDSLLIDILEIIKGTSVIYDANTSNRVLVSASAGVFRMPDGYKFKNSGDVMDKISNASHAAKMGGGDKIVFFDEKALEFKEKIMKIQQIFPTALENREFKVFYQPKIDIQTGELVGAEALCRWFRDGKIIPPMDFIPILEQNTDICTLDFYMLDSVCQDIRRWLDEKRKVVRISVNLSRKHMMDVDLLEHIMEIIDKNKVPHQYIEIELTETTTDVEFRDLKRVVSGLQQAGIYTSVDDFGMGYSSLNLIREIPWNVLKVDRSFLPLDNDTTSSTRSVMFRNVVTMAKELGLECIAEGVETKKQVDILRDNNCQFAQGYFFDKPLPLENFEERLSSHIYNVDDI